MVFISGPTGPAPLRDGSDDYPTDTVNDYQGVDNGVNMGTQGGFVWSVCVCVWVSVGVKLCMCIGVCDYVCMGVCERDSFSA